MNLSDDINDYCFFDFETRALSGTEPPFDSVKTCGAYRYNQTALATIFAYAIGNKPAQHAALNVGFHTTLYWRETSGELQDFYERAKAGKAWFVAWNTGFDRCVWNNGTSNFPPLRVEMTIDAMAQAVASNLPPGLEQASKYIGRGGKQTDGKALVNLFAAPDGPQPDDRPEEWRRFISYAVQDVDELREVFKATRALPRAEWEHYWASEHINDRGMAVDLPLCRAAVVLNDMDRTRTNKRISEITDGTITSVTQAVRLAQYVYDRTRSAEAREILVKEYDQDSEEEFKPARLSLARDRIAKSLAYYKAQNFPSTWNKSPHEIVELLELREFGGSSSPKKFQKILDLQNAGRLRGQYVFNGANQTGRFSSRGVQIHNLPRKSLGDIEEEAIETLMEMNDGRT